MPESRDVLTRPAPAPTRSVRYGSAAHEVYEVYAPGDGDRRALRPGLVLVHGGFWRSGYDRTHLRPLASRLAADGWDVALLEYRGTGADGGGWPHTLLDVRAGLARVRRDTSGAFDRPVLVGHSAGGHLALVLLHHPEGVGLTGAVSLAGCADLERVARLRLGDAAAQALLGGEPEEVPDVLAALDPVALGPTPAPVVLVHGTEDDRVPLAVSRSWMSRVGTTGRDRVVELPGCGHFGVIDPEHDAYAEVLAAVESLAGGTT